MNNPPPRLLTKATRRRPIGRRCGAVSALPFSPPRSSAPRRAAATRRPRPAPARPRPLPPLRPPARRPRRLPHGPQPSHRGAADHNDHHRRADHDGHDRRTADRDDRRTRRRRRRASARPLRRRGRHDRRADRRLRRRHHRLGQRRARHRCPRPCVLVRPTRHGNERPGDRDRDLHHRGDRPARPAAHASANPARTWSSANPSAAPRRSRSPSLLRRRGQRTRAHRRLPDHVARRPLLRVRRRHPKPPPPCSAVCRRLPPDRQQRTPRRRRRLRRSVQHRLARLVADGCDHSRRSRTARRPGGVRGGTPHRGLEPGPADTGLALRPPRTW